MTKKKLTLDDLIAKKLDKSKGIKSFPFHVESLEGELTVQVPDESYILDAIGHFGDENDMVGILKGYQELIYSSVSLFRKPELHTAYEVIEPTDIVAKLLTFNERMELGSKVLELSGFADTGNKLGE